MRKEAVKLHVSERERALTNKFRCRRSLRMKRRTDDNAKVQERRAKRKMMQILINGAGSEREVVRE